MGSSSQSQRRSARLESCPTSSQVRRRREREEASGCPPAPHNSVDQSVIVLDDTLQENTLEEVFPAPSLEVSANRGGRGRGRPVPVFLEDPEPETETTSRWRPSTPHLPGQYSDEDLAAHQNAINRALGLGVETSPTNMLELEEPSEEDLILIGDTTEEDEEEVSQSSSASSSPPPSIPGALQVFSPAASHLLEQTIDLTDSPPVSLPVSVASPSRSQSQPSHPPSPALKCPVCLDTFSGIRSRGIQLVSTVCGHVFCQRCLRQCLLTQQQCPTCRKRISHNDFHPLFL